MFRGMVKVDDSNLWIEGEGEGESEECVWQVPGQGIGKRRKNKKQEPGRKRGGGRAAALICGEIARAHVFNVLLVFG